MSICMSTLALILIIPNLIMIIDLTPTLHSLLPAQPPQPPLCSIQSTLCCKHSQQIQSSLRRMSELLSQNHQNYFSNAAYSYSAFTDQQRMDFDNEMSAMLVTINGKIGEMRAVVERVRFTCETEREHFKSMTLCLYQKFRAVEKQFRGFVEFSEGRRRKLQTMLGNQVKKQFKQVINQSPSRSTQRLQRKVSDIDPQLQQQSKQIYQQHLSHEKNIQQTHQKIQQINQVLDVMSNKVLEQEMLTSSFREIGEVGLFHIEKGNRNLVEANVLSKDTGKLWTAFFLVLAFSLLVLDYLKS